MNAIEARIADVMCGQFRIDRTAVDPGTTFATLNFDSLVIVELALVLDLEFGIEFEDGEITSGMTVSQVAGLVAAKIADKDTAKGAVG